MAAADMSWPAGPHSTCRGLLAGTAQCDLVRLLFSVVGALLLVVGTAGNALGFVVVGSARFRRSSTAVFVRALAVVDSAAMWAGLGRHVTAAIFGVDVREINPATCKVHLLLVYSAMDTSAWILVCISVERFLAVCRPSKGRFALRVTRKRAIACSAIAVACALSFNCHVIWTRGPTWTTSETRAAAELSAEEDAEAAAEVAAEAAAEAAAGAVADTAAETVAEAAAAAFAAENYSATAEVEQAKSTSASAAAVAANATGAPPTPRRLTCGYADDAAGHFWRRYQGWLAVVYGCVVPFLVMLTLSILIVRRLREAALRRSRWSSTRSYGSAASGNGSFSAGGSEYEHQSLTRMLLSATVFFLVITAPAFLFNMIESMAMSPEHLDSMSHANMKIADTVTALLHYLSYAVNFYIYLATGRGFRSDVREYLLQLKSSCRSSAIVNCCCYGCSRRRPQRSEATDSTDAPPAAAAAPHP